MAKSVKTRLKEIAQTQARALTDSQRQFIVDQSAAMGVKFEPTNTRCGDCYRDQAVILWRILAEQEAKKSKSRKYLLRAGVDVIWQGTRINATMTDEELEKLLAAGFPRVFFCRINGEDGRWL